MNREYPSIQPAACLNGLILKLIAVVTMLIDHVGVILFPGQMVFRYIGRIAFPIYVFLLVEGFFYTKSLRRYEVRLLIFALLSEIPFDLAFNGAVLEFSYQNAYFTLLLGLLMLHLIKFASEKTNPIYGGLYLELLILVAFVAAAFLVRSDYSGGGVLLIYCFYKFRSRHLVKIILLAAISLAFYVPQEIFSLLAVIPLLLYNGKRGFGQGSGPYWENEIKPSSVLVRYLFYLFYPAHLLILHFIALSIR